MLVATLALPILCCGTTSIDPIENDSRYFTVFGFLDERETRHAVRVIPITRLAENIVSPTQPQASIDGEVAVTDTRTGVRTRWNHRLERPDTPLTQTVFLPGITSPLGYAVKPRL